MGLKQSCLTFISPKFSLLFTSESTASSLCCLLHTFPLFSEHLTAQAQHQSANKSQSLPAFRYVSKSLNMPTKFSKVRKAVYQPFIQLIAAINLFQCGTYEYFTCSVRKTLWLKTVMYPRVRAQESHCFLHHTFIAIQLQFMQSFSRYFLLHLAV